MKAFELFCGFHRLACAAVVGTVTTACVTSPASGGSATLADVGANEFRSLDDVTLVDCLLPGQIRQLGTRMTYLAPRQRVKTTKSDCGIRGGEFVLFDRSDYGTALQTLLPQARAGDPVAQTYVGEIYERGLGIPGPDYAAAAEWYRKAAESGHRPAQTSLGSLYERGLGVRQDKSAALDWYRRATGVTEDRLIFESKLKAEQAAFKREIELRNRVAASLQQQLRRARSAAPAAAPTQAAAPRRAELERVAESARRDAASEAERVRRELHAVQELKNAETTRGAAGEAPGSGGKKAAQMGKLELSLRQQSDALADNAQRLSMLQ